MVSEEKKVFSLIESWDNKNINLALELAKGNIALLKKIEKRYLPILRLFGKEEVSDIFHLKNKRLEFIRNTQKFQVKSCDPIPYREDFKDVFASLPCENLGCYADIEMEFYWWISEMKNLKELNISKLLGKSPIPKSINNLTKLQLFHITESNLETLHENVGQLSSLEELKISETNISNLPNSIGDLSQLKYLTIEKGKLEKLPKSIGKLFLLIELNIKKNALEELPTTIGNLKSLEKLQLGFNKILKIPSSIGKLQELRYLFLEKNKIQKLPTEIQKLENLYWLSIEKNPLGKKLKIKKGQYIDAELIKVIVDQN